MSNLPPEHRHPSSDDEPAPEEMTGSFPAVDSEFLPPAEQSPPDASATGQFPAFGGQQTQGPSPTYFVDRNTGEQRIVEGGSERRVPPSGPDVGSAPSFNQPVTYDTSQVPQIGPQTRPDGAASGFEQRNPTMQTGMGLPDMTVGAPTGSAEAVDLPPVVNPHEGPSGGGADSVPSDDDIEGYVSTDDIDSELPARVRKKLAKKDQADSKLRRFRNERDSDSGWSYLAILGVIFLILVGFAFGCQRVSDADQSAARNAQLASEVNITVRVGGDQVSVVGALPDEETANQLVALVAEHYESSLITNALTVNPAISIGDSVLEITGQAQSGDARPGELEQTLGQRFDVPVATNTVEFGALPENLVSVSVQVEGAAVVVTGSVPDQTKLDLVKGAAEQVWGVENANTSGLVIDDVVWSGGRVTVSGDIPLGSSEPQRFADQIRLEGIFVDPGTNDDDVATATPEELRAAITRRLEVTPITFETGTQTLTDDDKETLNGIAELLLALPDDEEITIVGYSDDGGSSSEAAELAAQRARIAWAHLTQEQGVSDSADNEGSTADSISKITITFG